MTGPQTAHLDALNIAIQCLFSEHHAFACDPPILYHRLKYNCD